MHSDEPRFTMNGSLDGIRDGWVQAPFIVNLGSSDQGRSLIHVQKQKRSHSANINGSIRHLLKTIKKNLHLGKQMAVSGKKDSVASLAI